MYLYSLFPAAHCLREESRGADGGGRCRRWGGPSLPHGTAQLCAVMCGHQAGPPGSTTYFSFAWMFHVPFVIHQLAHAFCWNMCKKTEKRGTGSAFTCARSGCCERSSKPPVSSQLCGSVANGCVQTAVLFTSTRALQAAAHGLSGKGCAQKCDSRLPPWLSLSDLR